MNSNEQVLIPKARVGVLLGSKGVTRKRIARLGKVKLSVDSKDGSVEINGSVENCWIAKKVVEAIGRGFNPDIAIKLFKDTYDFALLDLRDFGGGTKKKQYSMKSRIIGTEGKTKRNIERYTGSDISIFGKTVGIIGPADTIELARRSIEIILEGSKQGTALRWLSAQFASE